MLEERGNFVDDQQSPNGWVHAEKRYQVGQEVRGVITRVAQFGVFVQIEPGIEGIVYTFELGTGPAALAGFATGQEMKLYVRNIDASRKRLELSPSNDPAPGLLLDEHALPPAVQRKTLAGTQLQPGKNIQTSSNQAERSICQTCQRQVQSAWKFCVYCGGSLQRCCPACGNTQPDLPGARYCYECGTPL